MRSIDCTVALRNVLDGAEHSLMDGHTNQSLELVCATLLELRLRAPDEIWDNVVKPLCFAHPLRTLLHQDPYSYRAYAKPRGYAGDAVMIDYVYFGILPSGTSSMGSQVFRYTTDCSNAYSTRDRKKRLAKYIDTVASRFTRPKIFSLACGHLREAQQAQAVTQGLIQEFYAVDQDKESLTVVEREQKAHGVVPVHMSLRSFLRDCGGFHLYHLVYATGLFDYVSLTVGVRLMQRMFNMLAPGGTLLIANFLPNSQGRGYMEAFMDWKLTYRSLKDLEALMIKIPEAGIMEKRLFPDAYGNIGYLEVIKR